MAVFCTILGHHSLWVVNMLILLIILFLIESRVIKDLAKMRHSGLA